MKRETILTLLRIIGGGGGAYVVEAARPAPRGKWRVELLDPFSRATLAYCDGASRRDGRRVALDALRRGFRLAEPFRVVRKPAPAPWVRAMGCDA
jgi:hypothetical protein